VRSLNFFQGMPLVSAAHDVSSQDPAGFCALSLTCSLQGEAGRYRIFPFEFACLLCRAGNADTMDGSHFCVDPQMHTRDGAPLLNKASRLHSWFRFGSNRYKFATGLMRKPRAGHLSTIIAA
jgi:hypothetical protein